MGLLSWLYELVLCIQLHLWAVCMLCWWYHLCLPRNVRSLIQPGYYIYLVGNTWIGNEKNCEHDKVFPINTTKFFQQTGLANKTVLCNILFSPAPIHGICFGIIIQPIGMVGHLTQFLFLQVLANYFVLLSLKCSSFCLSSRQPSIFFPFRVIS